MSFLDRFLNKVELIPFTDCWFWIGSKHSSKGYGSFRLKKPIKAHRASWILYKGEIPENLHVLHKCDNPLCVNPDHLFLGTNADNVKDKVAKKRQYKPLPEQHHFYGKKLSKNHVEKLKNSHLGKKASNETKLKMRNAQLKRWEKIKNNVN